MKYTEVLLTRSKAFYHSTAVSCGFPGHLTNGYVEGRSYKYGDSVVYTCNPGFKIRGDYRSVCQADGKWSNEPPRCDGEDFSASVVAYLTNVCLV